MLSESRVFIFLKHFVRHFSRDSVRNSVKKMKMYKQIVYRFLSNCEGRYVGRTFQRLQQRIKQHVPKTILQGPTSQDQNTFARSCETIRSLKAETSFFAIGKHLFQNLTCAREYNDGKFSILARGRTSFYFSTLKATYIKTSKLSLCKQKEFVYDLKIAHKFALLLLVASFTNHDEAFFLFRQLCLYISDSLHLFHSVSGSIS